MKKEYFMPETLALEVRLQDMICGSGSQNPGTPETPGVTPGDNFGTAPKRNSLLIRK